MSTRAIQDGLFETADDGSIALIGGFSPTSGQFHFPLLDTCPYSGATDVQRVLLSCQATLWAWTAVTAAPPGYTGAVPYGFGVVELVHEKLRVITRLRESDPSRLEFGQPMTLVAEELPGGELPGGELPGGELPGGELPGGVVTWAFA